MQFSVAILALAASASAHMILDFPKPYGQPASSPLDPSGSNFPCQATGPESYTVTQMNEMTAGETFDVQFNGSAVHGGGSCQFSITDSLTPSKDSQWKVIHSVIGGCPSNVTGNLKDDPTGHGAAIFPVTLPADLPEGQYSFAWTWNNRVGNREFYMNCAPLTVRGASGSASASGGDASTKDVASALGSLPDMSVVNMGSCVNKENFDFEYANPGQSVVYGDTANPGGDFDGPDCDKVIKMGAGAGNLGTPTTPTKPSDKPAPSAPVETEPAAISPIPSNPGGVFAPSASSAAPSVTASPTAAPKPSDAPAPIPAPSASPKPAPAPPAAGKSVPCDTDGVIVCIGSNQFGLCDRGFAYPMALSAGTSCSNGSISRRSIRFPRSFLQRRHGAHAAHHVLS